MTILSNDILKVGIIGCGLIGNKRAVVIKNDPTSVLRATSDVNVINAAVSLKQCGAGAGGRACRDWRDMLDKEKLDAVIVATPNKYLKKVSLWALQRGIHVLCEKPLGRNPWESERMVKINRDSALFNYCLWIDRRMYDRILPSVLRKVR